MKKRKFIAIILSIAMICTLPIFTFADTKDSTTSYLSDIQKSSAPLIKVGDTLKFPTSEEPLIYKFVAEKSGIYGVQGTLSKDSPEDFSVLVCRETSKEVCQIIDSFEGYSIIEYDIEMSSNCFKKGNTYYLVISNPNKCTIDNLHFKYIKTKTVKVSSTKGGSIYKNESMKSKVKTTKLQDSQEGGDTVYVHPNKGYTFKGFYCNGSKVKTIYDGNDVYGLYYTNKITTNMLTAKFVKLRGSALKLSTSKISGLKGSIKENTATLDWKASTDPKVQYEAVFSTYPSAYATASKKVSENTYSFDFPIDLKQGEKLKGKVRAFKTFNGISVASKWTTVIIKK